MFQSLTRKEFNFLNHSNLIVPLGYCKALLCFYFVTNIFEVVNYCCKMLQECNDVAKDIPYLEDAEECEEIFYDDCLEITESIPGNPRPL